MQQMYLLILCHLDEILNLQTNENFFELVISIIVLSKWVAS